MPTYEYLCQACSHRFETWQKMTDEPLTICPECGGHIRRVLYPAGIVFKGSGFYKTDYGNGSGAKANGEHKKAESNGEKAAGEAKPSESKPAESKSSESSTSSASSSTSTTSASATAK